GRSRLTARENRRFSLPERLRINLAPYRRDRRSSSGEADRQGGRIERFSLPARPARRSLRLLVEVGLRLGRAGGAAGGWRGRRRALGRARGRCAVVAGAAGAFTVVHGAR